MDLNLVIILATMLATTTLVVAGYAVLAPQFKARARLRRRIAWAARHEGAQADSDRQQRGGGRKREIQSRLKEAETKKSTKQTFSQRFRNALRMAGLSMSLGQFFLMCGLLSLVVAGIYLAMGYPAIGAVPAAIAGGFGLPRSVVGWLGKRRVKQFTLRFADAVDVIIRGIRSGLPVRECLNIIARESPEPISGVFRELVEAQRIGLTLDQALARALELMPTPEMKFFTIVLSIQQRTGGNLAETLQNLSNVLRARKRMQDKVQALSSEAKSSAMIIGSLPFIMTGLLWLVSPDYIALLFTDKLGTYMILAGLTWMSIGVIVMKQMISFEI
ncbi:MAG: type II secretion system F family protein [Alphaproteobacteria bacterium]|nr:type II secretion system F family protein [Alphaproteobacteria bacterium]